MRALIIDDNQSVRMFVERVLREAGYETTTAKDGVSAQGVVLQEGAPDLVVTDESLPGMSGHEFARWLRSNFSSVKVLFLTGYVSRAYSDPLEVLDNDAYLEKPCTVNGLLQAVKMLIGPAGDASGPACAQSAQ